MIDLHHAYNICRREMRTALFYKTPVNYIVFYHVWSFPKKNLHNFNDITDDCSDMFQAMGSSLAQI